MKVILHTVWFYLKVETTLCSGASLHFLLIILIPYLLLILFSLNEVGSDLSCQRNDKNWSTVLDLLYPSADNKMRQWDNMKTYLKRKLDFGSSPFLGLTSFPKPWLRCMIPSEVIQELCFLLVSKFYVVSKIYAPMNCKSHSITSHCPNRQPQHPQNTSSLWYAYS